MADVSVDRGTLTLELTSAEHVEGFHRSIAVPISSVTAVRVAPDIWSELRGIRAPGTGLPGVIAVGTRRGSFGKDFAAVHGQGPGVVVELSGQEFQRFVLTSADPEALRAHIARAAGLD